MRHLPRSILQGQISWDTFLNPNFNPNPTPYTDFCMCSGSHCLSTGWLLRRGLSRWKPYVGFWRNPSWRSSENWTATLWVKFLQIGGRGLATARLRVSSQFGHYTQQALCPSWMMFWTRLYPSRTGRGWWTNCAGSASFGWAALGFDTQVITAGFARLLRQGFWVRQSRALLAYYGSVPGRCFIVLVGWFVLGLNFVVAAKSTHYCIAHM